MIFATTRRQAKLETETRRPTLDAHCIGYCNELDRAVTDRSKVSLTNDSRPGMAQERCFRTFILFTASRVKSASRSGVAT